MAKFILFKLISTENNYSGEDCILILRTILSKSKRLISIIEKFEKEKNIDQVISSVKPPIFWKEKELVKKQSLLAKECGCHGIVCAGSDLKFVKKIFKGEIFTPGIRLKGDSSGDQKRVMSPKKAFQNGSSALVLGRSIVKGNIRNNLIKLIKELS